MMRHLIAIVTISMLVAGCGSKKETTITNADGEKMTISADTSGENATIKTDKGSITANTGAAGAIFPAGIPQYPGSKVTGNINFNGTDKESSKTITLETAATPAEVAAFYKSRMTEAKIPINSEMTMNDTAMLTSNNQATGKTVSVMASVSEGKTSVVISESHK
jgi:hypothetical protein